MTAIPIPAGPRPGRLWSRTGDMWGEFVDGKHRLWIYHGWWHGWVLVTAAGDYRLPRDRDDWYTR